MYRTCLFCHETLGRNEAIEALPIGRRLAYDPERGRLWVVCRKCGRWSLTPFEERWEALEECERAFRGTRLRVSTDNIGLARLREGLELVRIGPALRPELAAWRYGDQFGRRRRRQLLLGGSLALGVGALLIGGPAAGILTSGGVNAINILLQLGVQYRDRRHVRGHVPVPGDGAGAPRLLPIAAVHARRSRLVPDADGGWALELAYRGPGERLEYAFWSGVRHRAPTMLLTGAEALRAAGLVLPHVNEAGGTREQVQDAVRVVEEAGDVARCFARAAARPGTEGRVGSAWQLGGKRPAEPGSLAALPTPVRLALEMAAHEESERRALEGELAELERAWREAEEIAAIADDLLLPEATHARLERLRATADDAPT